MSNVLDAELITATPAPARIFEAGAPYTLAAYQPLFNGDPVCNPDWRAPADVREAWYRSADYWRMTHKDALIRGRLEYAAMCRRQLAYVLLCIRFYASDEGSK